MNIFVLDKNPIKAAKYQPDKMLVKMVVETAQLLSTTHRVLDGNKRADEHAMYRPTHKNHPCAIWTRSSSSNYRWLYSHFVALAEEYTKRYEKVHKSFQKLGHALANEPAAISKSLLTPFAQAMPDQYRNPNDVVSAYRTYVICDKYYAEWNRSTPKPEWWSTECY